MAGMLATDAAVGLNGKRIPTAIFWGDRDATFAGPSRTRWCRRSGGRAAGLSRDRPRPALGASGPVRERPARLPRTDYVVLRAGAIRATIAVTLSVPPSASAAATSSRAAVSAVSARPRISATRSSGTCLVQPVGAQQQRVSRRKVHQPDGRRHLGATHRADEDPAGARAPSLLVGPRARLHHELAHALVPGELAEPAAAEVEGAAVADVDDVRPRPHQRHQRERRGRPSGRSAAPREPLVRRQDRAFELIQKLVLPAHVEIVEAAGRLPQVLDQRGNRGFAGERAAGLAPHAVRYDEYLGLRTPVPVKRGPIADAALEQLDRLPQGGDNEMVLVDSCEPGRYRSVRTRLP